MIRVFLLLFSLLCTTQFQAMSNGNKQFNSYATDVLDTVFYQRTSPSIITEHEWKEFQLDRLLIFLDRTKTSFGQWGLKQLLYPVANSNDLAQRKEFILFLIENEKELAYFQHQLEKFKAIEKSLLAYWDHHDAVNNAAESFYYIVPGVNTYLNKSNLALNGSVVTKMFTAWTGLVALLCLQGVSDEFNQWIIGNKPSFNFMQGIRAGIYEPLRQHSWSRYLFQEGELSSPTFKDLIRANMFGSFRDRYEVLKKGYSFDPQTVGLPASFGFQGNVATNTAYNVGAFFTAAIPTLLYDYSWGMSLLSVGGNIVSMYKTLNQLYGRVVDVATGFNAIKNIDNRIKKHFITLTNPYTNFGYPDSMSVLLQGLHGKNKQSVVYSRGRILNVHKKITEIKESLVPFLQRVAFLDAFCSIAQLYKESQKWPVKFSFVEFVPSQEPFLLYEKAWLPLLPYDTAVTNNLCLGRGVDCPSKIIITGPNGGGKSTLLKTYMAVILAQSWLIVPAVFGEQTLFSEIKTSIAPHEDLAQGLSTFMAEKKRMIELFTCMEENEAQRRKTLIIVDEPYKGTVDDESAKRIYKFGRDSAEFTQSLIALATHVKKPIDLEYDTNGIFGNYQVEIEEIAPGEFKRLFKLKKGPAMWWFDDADKRSRFIDWISTKPLVAH